MFNKIFKSGTNELSDDFFHDISTDIFLIVAFIMFFLFSYLFKNTNGRREHISPILILIRLLILLAELGHI